MRNGEEVFLMAGIAMLVLALIAIVAVLAVSRREDDDPDRAEDRMDDVQIPAQRKPSDVVVEQQQQERT